MPRRMMEGCKMGGVVSGWLFVGRWMWKKGEGGEVIE